MNRKKLFAAMALAAVAAVLPLGSAQAVAGDHVVAGNSVAGSFDIKALVASEAAQAGSLLLNGAQQMINCVTVTARSDGAHTAVLRLGGLTLTVAQAAQSTQAGWILSTNGPSACGGGGRQVGAGVGVFAIAA